MVMTISDAAEVAAETCVGASCRWPRPAPPTAQLPRGPGFLRARPEFCTLNTHVHHRRSQLPGAQNSEGERENLQDRAGAVQWVWPGLLRQLTPTLRMILSFPPSACAQMQVDYQWSAEFSSPTSYRPRHRRCATPHHSRSTMRPLASDFVTSP